MIDRMEQIKARLNSPPYGEFIAHAREDVPYLLAEVERLTGLVEKVREAIGPAPAAAPDNPFDYDPWDDDSVDAGNLDDVVHAAVTEGWCAGSAYERACIRAALDGEATS